MNKLAGPIFIRFHCLVGRGRFLHSISIEHLYEELEDEGTISFRGSAQCHAVMPYLWDILAYIDDMSMLIRMLFCGILVDTIRLMNSVESLI